MTFQTTLATLLVLHVIGLVMMAGAVLADFSLRSRFNTFLVKDKTRALTLLEGSAALLPLIGVGALLLILSGTAMVIQLKSAVTQMVWFRVKMPLVILLVLNGSVLARRLGLRLYRLLSVETDSNTSRISTLQSRLRLVYVLQLFLFLSIFVLSIFKF
jgi:hypothetical protein